MLTFYVACNLTMRENHKIRTFIVFPTTKFRIQNFLCGRGYFTKDDSINEDQSSSGVIVAGIVNVWYTK